MFTTLLMVSLAVGEPNPQTALPKLKMPKLVDGHAPVKPLSSQGLIQPVLSTAPVVSSQPSLNLPALPGPVAAQGSTGLQVWRCERVPSIPVVGRLMDAIGHPHQWLIIRDPVGNVIHAPGLGNVAGVPGTKGQWDLPLSKTFIKNHQTDTARTCTPFPVVDPLCVVLRTPYNQYQGRWLPFVNDCNTFAQRTINACQLPANLPLLNPKQATAWDKLTLLPRADSPKYRLIDVKLPGVVSGGYQAPKPKKAGK